MPRSLSHYRIRPARMSPRTRRVSSSLVVSKESWVTDQKIGAAIAIWSWMRPHTCLLALALAIGVSTVATPLRADRSIIKQPGQHADYSFEAEPHALLGLWGVPGPGGGTGFGVGFRGSIPIVDNGFVKTINNSVAISFGVDWLRYDVDNWCRRFRPNRPVDCGFDDNFDIFWLPVAMQWNFFLSENWSVFGEPGLALRINDDHFDDDVNLDFVLYAGGRFHFSDKVSLTMRLGWPSALSVGVSFFL